MNPLLAEAIKELAAPYAQSCVEYLSNFGKTSDDNKEDIEAMTEELREVMRERDYLRGQLNEIKAAYNQLRRALYPELASTKWNTEK